MLFPSPCHASLNIQMRVTYSKREYPRLIIIHPRRALMCTAAATIGGRTAAHKGRTYTPWRRKSGMLVRKETTMRTTHQKHRQPRRNATSAPGIMMSSPYPISAESAGRLVMESDRLWRAYWFWGQAQKLLLSVFPVVIVFLIWLVVVHEQFRATAPIMAFCAGWALVAMQQRQRALLNEIKELDTKLPDQSKAQRRD